MVKLTRTRASHLDGHRVSRVEWNFRKTSLETPTRQQSAGVTTDNLQFFPFATQHDFYQHIYIWTMSRDSTGHCLCAKFCGYLARIERENRKCPNEGTCSMGGYNLYTPAAENRACLKALNRWDKGNDFFIEKFFEPSLIKRFFFIWFDNKKRERESS
jgi:hypothetical protein